MRRALTLLSLTLVGLWLTVLPALAAEEGKASEPDEVNGIVLSLILGVIVGVGLFLDAYSNGPAVNDHAEHH